MVALLQMNSGRADGERIVHLERALSQAKEEALALSKKIKSQDASQVSRLLQWKLVERGYQAYRQVDTVSYKIKYHQLTLRV